ncbi:hypothetical protein [Viridibacillus arvi]|uniref:hypothetical protein n=1 Tax=Viridibacillus arvi TaxID=263475 RepID=UPI0012EDABC2|nr:hypothetical protein [Viridibacillus arvi]
MKGNVSMRGTSIKSYVDDNDVIVKAKVERYINGEKVSDYTIVVGSILVVKPQQAKTKAS